MHNFLKKVGFFELFRSTVVFSLISGTCAFAGDSLNQSRDTLESVLSRSSSPVPLSGSQHLHISSDNFADSVTAETGHNVAFGLNTLEDINHISHDILQKKGEEQLLKSYDTARSVILSLLKDINIEEQDVPALSKHFLNKGNVIGNETMLPLLSMEEIANVFVGLEDKSSFNISLIRLASSAMNNGGAYTDQGNIGTLRSNDPQIQKFVSDCYFIASQWEYTNLSYLMADFRLLPQHRENVNATYFAQSILGKKQTINRFFNIMQLSAWSMHRSHVCVESTACAPVQPYRTQYQMVQESLHTLGSWMDGYYAAQVLRQPYLYDLFASSKHIQDCLEGLASPTGELTYEQVVTLLADSADAKLSEILDIGDYKVSGLFTKTVNEGGAFKAAGDQVWARDFWKNVTQPLYIEALNTYYSEMLPNYTKMYYLFKYQHKALFSKYAPLLPIV